MLNELAKICGQNKSSTREIEKKEKEIAASFAFAPPAAKVAAAEHDGCLMKTEKALSLWLDGGQKTCSDRGQRVHQKALSLRRLQQGPRSE